MTGYWRQSCYFPISFVNPRGATSVFLSTDGVTGPRGQVTEAAMICS